MWASYGVVLADYVAQVTPVHSRIVHWTIAVIFLVLVAGLNILGIRLVGKLTLVLLLLQMLPVAAFVYLGFTHAHFNPFHPWMPTGRLWREVYGVGLALALWIYSGFEQLSPVIEEVEEPWAQFSSRACDRCSTGGGDLLLAHGRRLGSTGQLAGVADGVSGYCGPSAGWEQHGLCDVCRIGALRLCAA